MQEYICISYIWQGVDKQDTQWSHTAEKQNKEFKELDQHEKILDQKLGRHEKIFTYQGNANQNHIKT